MGHFTQKVTKLMYIYSTFMLYNLLVFLQSELQQKQLETESLTSSLKVRAYIGLCFYRY